MTELLIATVLVGFVFVGAASMYTSALKFLQARENVDVTASPDIAVEPVTRKVACALQGGISPASQLNIRMDQTCGGAALATPAVAGDDSWWHFRLTNSQLLALERSSN